MYYIDREDINLPNWQNDETSIVATDTKPSGWGFFTEEIAWFLCDFFKHRLDPEQKLIFYSLYINGMTYIEIADRFHISHQAIDRKIRKINKMLGHNWRYKDRWGK